MTAARIGRPRAVPSARELHCIPKDIIGKLKDIIGKLLIALTDGESENQTQFASCAQYSLFAIHTAAH